MSSVQRQLNLYGFRCVSRGEDKGSFYHPNFQRGEWEKAKLIRRCVQNHNQFGLQHWKMPSDMKTFVDNTDVKDLEDLQDHHDSSAAELDADPSAHNMKNQPLSSVSVKAMMPRRNDWAWPPVHVLEQQRNVNTNITKSFQTSTDLAKDLVKSVTSQQPLANAQSTQPSTLASRLGFRWNIHLEGEVAAPAGGLDYLNANNATAVSSVQADSFFPEHQPAHEHAGQSYGLSSHPSDIFEELIEMCQDLDSFLEDCDATTVW
jgi:hypothetical protein